MEIYLVKIKKYEKNLPRLKSKPSEGDFIIKIYEVANNYDEAIINEVISDIENYLSSEEGKTLHEREQFDSSMKIEDSPFLNVRVTNSLKSQGIEFFKDLEEYTRGEVVDFRNLGPASMKTLEKVMKVYNVRFKAES